MTFLLGVACFFAITGCVVFLVLWAQERRAAEGSREEAERVKAEASQVANAARAEIQKLAAINARVAKWLVVADADDKARELLESAKAAVDQAENDARILVTNAEVQYSTTIAAAQQEADRATSEARAKARQLREEAAAALHAATERASEIVAEAHKRAEATAGKAFDAVQNAERYEHTANAMRRLIEGYGDEYLRPVTSLLDRLAEEFAHQDAGRHLKVARDQTKALIKAGQASQCDYVESVRREGAERFVLDAFNGKVDSILSRVRHDNYGKLETEIRDAFAIVNHGGTPFRNARITAQYLEARIAELNWAAIAQELKRQEQEEQRRIREQMREEERARREYAKAMRDAEKEESVLRKAMARAQAQIDAATAEQRAVFEVQLAELNAKLLEAEERNQRAISMAQQTRRGHVYIISNIGSFGEDVYKIGLTRRLEPLDRIKELGDASVPFDFDVHAIILSEDAPALESRLHKHFVLHQVNKVNYRKEFFRSRIADIRHEIEQLGIEAKWTMLAEAREFRETIAIDRAIQSDPDARSQWLNRQLSLDPVDYEEMVPVDEVPD